MAADKFYAEKVHQTMVKLFHYLHRFKLLPIGFEMKNKKMLMLETFMILK